MLTVAKLIKKLKKLDQSALVVWRDHDQSADEINGFASNVEEIDGSDLSRDMSDLDAGVKLAVIS